MTAHVLCESGDNGSPDCTSQYPTKRSIYHDFQTSDASYPVRCILSLGGDRCGSDFNVDNSPAAVDNPAGGDILDPGLIYAAKSPDQWVGKRVTLRNVANQDTNNDGNFGVGRDGRHRLLIVKQDNNPNLTALHVRKGDVVTVTGTVQPASKYQSNVTSSSKGSMHDAEKSSGLFVMAETSASRPLTSTRRTRSRPSEWGR